MELKCWEARPGHGGARPRPWRWPHNGRKGGANDGEEGADLGRWPHAAQRLTRPTLDFLICF